MKKIILACDLDNTLIHSYKTKKDGDVCIEWIHEKEQGYMDKETYMGLPDLGSSVMIVPVTTRSIEQYQRLMWPAEWHPRFSVTTNGAILLEESETDYEWMSESKKCASGYMNEMLGLMERLIAEDDYLRCRMVDDMYLFSYCKEGVSISEKVKKYSDISDLSVVASGKKIYFFPPGINKGAAVRRIRKRFSPDYVIAAGDSSIDLPMLDEADYAICKGDVYDLVSSPEKIVFDMTKSFIENIVDALRF